MDIPREVSKSRKLRRPLMIGGGLVAAALVTLAVSRLEPAPPAIDRSTIWTDTVQRGEMLRNVRGPGTLIPERARWVPAAIGGRIERILVNPGDEVTAEAVLLELSNPDVQLEALDAQRQLAQAEAEMVNLELNLQTQRLAQESTVATLESEYREARRRADAAEELAGRNLIPRMELEEARDRAEEMRSRLERERQQLRLLLESRDSRLAVQRSQVERLRSIVAFHAERSASMQVRAGAAGTIQELSVQVGQWVTPGTTLTRVVEPGRLQAELRIPETQARDLAVGQPARIDTRNGIVDGWVTRIDPSVQSGAVTVEVRLDGELPRGARPDLSVDGMIEVDRLNGVLFAGRPAYAQPEAQASVWKLVEGGRYAVRTPVRLGRASVNTIEIVEGLGPGDEIILSDMSRWDDVERVRLRN